MALRHMALVLMATAMSPVQGSTPPDAAMVFFLRDSGADVVVDSIGLADGEMKVLSQQEVLAVILPFGTTGMSGDVVQKAQRTGRIAVLRRGDEIRTTIRRPDGQQRDLPAVTLADLAAVDIRVNVTGGSGLRKAYLIRGCRDVEPAPGPVIDMFGGNVPLVAGDFAITTEVRPAVADAPLEGRAPLESDHGLLFVGGRSPVRPPAGSSWTSGQAPRRWTAVRCPPTSRCGHSVGSKLRRAGRATSTPSCTAPAVKSPASWGRPCSPS